MSAKVNRKVENICPCCSRVLLRHLGNDRIYWFCRNCYQEMPNLNFTIDKKTVASYQTELVFKKSDRDLREF